MNASRRREYPGGEFFLPCALVVKRLDPGERHDKAGARRRCSGSTVSQPELRCVAAPRMFRTCSPWPQRSSRSPRSATTSRRSPTRSRRICARRVGSGSTGSAKPVVARTELGATVAGRARRAHSTRCRATGNREHEIDGEVLSGLGSVDMKGGIAVMLALAVTVAEPAHRTSPSSSIRARRSDRSTTDCGIFAATRPRPSCCRRRSARRADVRLRRSGLPGNTARARAIRAASRAHTARPFTGVNAIHRLAPLLERLRGVRIAPGCHSTVASTPSSSRPSESREGIAGNVVPDEASVRINFRFAPDRDARAAVASPARAARASHRRRDRATRSRCSR